MNKIELTELELKVLKQNVSGDFSPMNATEEEAAAMNSVLRKAEDLMDELEAYDELENSLMLWFLCKYESQAEQEKA